MEIQQLRFWAQIVFNIHTVLKIQNIIKFRNIEASAFRGFHVLRIGLIEDST